MQLDVISKVCGTPAPADWPEIVNLPGWGTMKPKKTYRRRIGEEFRDKMPATALDLLDQMLKLDPARRISAENALNHPWLKNFHPDEMEPPPLPRNQDCHELWSKRRKRQLKEIPEGNNGNNSNSNNNNLSSQTLKTSAPLTYAQHKEAAGKMSKDDIGSNGYECFNKRLEGDSDSPNNALPAETANVNLSEISYSPPLVPPTSDSESVSQSNHLTSACESSFEPPPPPSLSQLDQ